MPLKEGDETEVFSNVLVVDGREMAKRNSSVICAFPDDCPKAFLRGMEKPIPRSQVPEGFEFPGDNGTDQAEPFEVEVSAWIVQQWEDEPAFTMPGVEILREVEGKYGPQLKVRANGKESFVALKGLHHKNVLTRPGDRGDLLVFNWCAKAVGWTGEDGGSSGGGGEGKRKQAAPKGGTSQATPRSGTSAATRPAANVGQDARNSAPPAEDDGELPDW